MTKEKMICATSTALIGIAASSLVITANVPLLYTLSSVVAISVAVGVSSYLGMGGRMPREKRLREK